MFAESRPRRGGGRSVGPPVLVRGDLIGNRNDLGRLPISRGLGRSGRCSGDRVRVEIGHAVILLMNATFLEVLRETK